MLGTYLAVCLFLIVLGYYWFKWLTNPLRRIPCPPRIPVLGNLHQMMTNDRAHILFSDWKDTYGDIFCVQMLNDYIVVLNSVETIREALVDKGIQVGGRPSTFRVNYTCYNGQDMSFQDYSPKVQYMRKVAHWAIKSYGVGMTRLEEIVQNQISDLLNDLTTFKGRPCNPQPKLHTLFCNVMTSMIFGRSFTPSSVEVSEIMTFDRLISAGLHPTEKDKVMLDLFPWFRHFGGTAFKNLKRGVEARDAFLDKQFKMMKETVDAENVRGIFDALLLSEDNISNLDDGVTAKVHLSEQNIKAMIFDIVLAGAVTSSTASVMAVLVLLNYPDIQYKLRKEVLTVITDVRQPCLDDRQHMPYMEAFIFELLRYMAHVPLALPHVTLEDVTLGGYVVPRGTQVLLNTWSVSHDERYYKDPWLFSPERFLDVDGHLLSADHPVRRNLLAFGAGRRICVGENLAKSRLFLVLSSIIQRFDIKPENDHDIPSSDPRHFSVGLVLLPDQFRCRFVERTN